MSQPYEEQGREDKERAKHRVGVTVAGGTGDGVLDLAGQNAP
jgi:hypothetical protein